MNESTDVIQHPRLRRCTKILIPFNANVCVKRSSVHFLRLQTQKPEFVVHLGLNLAWLKNLPETFSLVSSARAFDSPVISVSLQLACGLCLFHIRWTI